MSAQFGAHRTLRKRREEATHGIRSNLGLISV